MADKPTINHGKYFLTLVFASILLASFGMISHDAFAMGKAPGSCANEYDGPIVSAKINNGTQTFDALTTPTFQLSPKGTYYLLFIIHTPSQDSKGNSNLGTVWTNTNINGFENGACNDGAGPNQNYTIAFSWSCGSNRCDSSTIWGTTVNEFSYGTNFVTSSNTNANNTTAPNSPVNITPTPISSSQIDLMWNAPTNSTVTGYKIERSTDGGSTWSTIVSNTNSTVTMYFDTGLVPHTAYYYRVSAINKMGTSLSSGTAYGTTFVFQPRLTIASQDTSGNALSFNATLSQNGSKITSGLTPVTFTLKTNQTYNVNVTDSSKFVFDHWLDNGNTTRDRSISISDNTVLTAVYKQVISALTISSYDTFGDVVNGLNTTISQNGKTVSTGSTPATFTVNVGQTYTVTVANFSNPNSFVYWKDNNSTSNSRTFTATTSDATLAAIYSTAGRTPVIDVIPIGSSPLDITVNPKTNMIYTANSGDNDVGILNGSTDKVVGRLNVSFNTHGVGVNPNTNTIYANDYDGILFVFNGTTGATLSSIQNAGWGNGFATNMATNMIYMSNYDHGSVTVIDGATNKIVTDIPVGNGPRGIAVNPHTDKIYVAGDSSIKVIDGSTNTVVGTITNGNSTFGIAVNPNTNKVYVSNQYYNTGSNIIDGNTVSVIDGSTGAIISTIQVGNTPTGVAVDPNTNLIYVTNSRSNTVSVIDGSTDSVISNTSTAQFGGPPQLIAVDPNTNRIYAVNEGSATITLMDGNFFKTNSSNTATIPGTPTGLTTTASSSQINLSWTAPSNSGGSPITGYKIERSTGNGTTWSTVQSNTGSTATTYNDTGLSPSTTYTYRVSAINSVGTSSTSNTASATTQTAAPPAGIVLNNIQSTSGTVSSSPYQITLANFNAGTGSNQLLVVGISANNNNVASVTFGGTQLTKKVSSFSNNDAEFWYLKNPANTGNIVVTMVGSTSAVVGAYSFSGVNQSSPLPTSTTNHNSAAGSPTITITTTNPNDWVLDLPSIYGGVTLGSPTCTQQWNTHMPSAITGASSSVMQTTAGSVTCKWTASSSEMWDDVAVEVKASGIGSGSTPTVPSSPIGLTASAASSSQINLSWTAPANSGGATITGYKIERSTDSGSTWSSLVANTGSTSAKYSDTGLSPSTSYTYRVSAINSVGSSAPSNVSSATTPSNMTVPSPPTGLATTAVSSSQINLSWTAPSSNGGSAITGYDVQRSVNNGNTWSTVVSNTGSTATVYNDTGLAPSTSYTYRVSAINSVGTSSPSNVSSATTSTVTTSGGITLANIQSTSGSTSPSNPIMLADFNVGTGNNRLLVVGVSADNSNAASVTFGGVPLTKKVSTFSNNDAEFWYLKNPTGTGAIVVTMSGSTSAIVGAYSFSGVNQSSPLPTSIVNHNSAASSPAVSLTTKFANDWVLDLPSIYGGVTLGSPTCTQQWNTNMPSAITGASSSTMVQSPGSVTCKWTASSADLWDDAAVEIAASK